MRKIAVFGGSFNPIHLGHMHMISAIDAAYRFDEILLMPSNIPPHKDATEIIAGEHRYAMCALAAAQLGRRYHAEGIELTLPDKSYTVNTLIKLKALYPNDQLYLIVGSDMLLSFDRWYRYTDILRMANLLAAARNPDEYDCLRDKAAALQRDVPYAKIEVQKMDVMPMSSTEIREKLRAGEDVSAFLAPDVYAYIVEHRLFKEKQS